MDRLSDDYAQGSASVLANLDANLTAVSDHNVTLLSDIRHLDRFAYRHHGWRELYGVRCAGPDYDGHHYEHLRKRRGVIFRREIQQQC